MPFLLLRWMALLPVLFGSLTGVAQSLPIKFGQPDSKDFLASTFAADSAAEAVVLCDYGSTRIAPGAGSNFLTTCERVVRIKILKKSGYRWATVEVPLISSQQLTNLKGFTYNMVNGAVVKEKLTDEGTFTDNILEQLHVRKFTLPNVREGAVIEFSYNTVLGHFMSPPDWEFQRPIPVRWSEYRTSIPEWFDHKVLVQGYLPLALKERTESNTALPNGSVQILNNRWAMRNVPAFVTEPFITTPRDYEARIEFELASVLSPSHMTVYNATRTWEKVDHDLLDNESFGLQLDRGGFLKEELAQRALPASAPLEERVAVVHALVRDAVHYNDRNGIYTSASLRKTYQDIRRGNAADLNLLLIAALRTAGIPADPVLISTRDHGRVNAAVPLASHFNYVIAAVALPDGLPLLLDATEPLLPCGALPERCLNQVGRLISRAPATTERWLEIQPRHRKVHFQSLQLTLSPEGTISGNVHEEYGGYAAAGERAELQQGEAKYRSRLASRFIDWTVLKLTIGNRDDLDRSLNLDYVFTQAANDNAPAGTFYLSPMASLQPEQNPFKLENRTYPVDFGMAQEETIVLKLTLPAGYEPAEMPKSTMVDLPDNGGRYQYTISMTADNIVQLSSRMILRKPVYEAAEYEHLREFYRLMLAKQGEKLVIRKKA